ncbi:MAG: substrate-binding domain-containing protein [Proteobacteria bacterium]|nr:substrate-binding domain-containing protein [Pseudomonadota bacterium]MBU0965903.1 substrate-binding domain-containing protein [Pseudomonadota bacterium]
MKKFLFLLLAGIFVLSGCQKAAKQETSKELLIYCGITMIMPVQEIAKIIEQQENCTIKITKQGTGSLLSSIKANRVGDLFLPGSESYIKTCIAEGLVKETVAVGYNRAALIVQKGNPLHITPDVKNLTSKQYRVVLGSAENGSIGQETKRILSSLGIYQEALDNSLFLTTDSKGMVKAILDKNADLALNWHATSVWDENRPYMDELPLDDGIAPSQRLVLGLLTFSPYPDIARRFMELASSEQGQEIFARYGFMGK